jgi:hypothetical protein
MSDQYFIQLNRSIMELYDRGHLMTPGEMAISLNSIATNAHRMVDRRRQALNLPPPDLPTAPMVNTANGPVPLPPGGMVNVTTGRAVTRQDLELRLGRSLTPTTPPPVIRPTNELQPDKRKILSRAAFAANCAEVCAICLDNHQKGDSLTTCCGHDFGKECYRKWIYSPASNQKCPTCRTVNPKITVYGKRVYRATQNNLVNVVENNVV